MHASRPPRRILVVDDDPHHNRIASALLADAGYEVEVATDSAEAVRKNFDFRPDLVLLDIMMPRWSGHAASAALRAVRPDLPIVVLSALGSPADVREGIDWGASRYLTKPYDPDELLRTIASLVPPAAAAADGPDRA